MPEFFFRRVIAKCFLFIPSLLLSVGNNGGNDVAGGGGGSVG